MRTTRHSFHVSVKNEKTRQKLIEFLVENEIPELTLSTVNTLYYDVNTGKPDIR